MTTASGIESIGRDAMGANATGGVIEAADVF